MLHPATKRNSISRMTRKPQLPFTKKAKKVVVPRVARTRNGNSETESQHMGKIRSALRNISRWWKPFQQCLNAVSRSHTVGRMRRVEYQCAVCQGWYNRKQVEVNHKHAVGSLKSYNDLPGFCERLFIEDISLLEVVCIECHLSITKEQRKSS